MSQHRPTPAVAPASTTEPVFEVNDVVRPRSPFRRNRRQLCTVVAVDKTQIDGISVHTVRDLDTGRRLWLYADELELVEKGPHRLTAEDDPC